LMPSWWSIVAWLPPWVHGQYRVTDDARRVVVGASLGGLMAAYCALRLRYPNAFGNVVSQSGAFWRSAGPAAGNRRLHPRGRLARSPVRAVPAAADAFLPGGGPV
jgi:enterochelin esterase-like enzyme